MNHEKQPEALLLADKLETSFSVRDRWSASCHLRHLYCRVQELESELVKEAARTAEEKLRADQMSQQHSAQAALNSEARKELAEIKLAATQPAAQGMDISIVREACARMCDSRGESLQSGGMFVAANEAFKCSASIRQHPSFFIHLNDVQAAKQGGA